MAWTLKANTVKLLATTDAIDTTGADLIVVTVADFSTTPITLSDSKSNTWNGLTAIGNGDPFTRMFWSTPSSVGSGHTFSTNGDFYAIAVQAWSGSAASPFDVQNGAEGAGAQSTVQTGSITPSENNELIVSGFGMSANSGGGGTASIDSSFTISDQAASVGGVNEGVAMAYLTQGTAAAVNPTWTKTGTASNGLDGLIASFKMAAAATGGPFPMFTPPLRGGMQQLGGGMQG